MRSPNRIVLTGIIVLFAVSAHAHSLTTFDPPGSTLTWPLSINNVGEITGFYRDAANIAHGFIRDARGAIISFSGPAGVGSEGTFSRAINDAGTVTGVYDTLHTHSFIRDAQGVLTSFDAPGAGSRGFTQSWSINNAGAVAGNWGDGFSAHAYFRDAQGAFTSFDVPGATFIFNAFINDSAVVAGTYFVDGTPHGFIRDAQGALTTFDAPGSTATFIEAINNAGAVSGLSYVVGGPPSHGYIRNARGAFASFDAPGFLIEHVSINNAGVVTGFYFFGSTNHGFIRDAQGAFTNFDAPDSNSTESFGINNAGAVTGRYSDANGFLHGFIRDAPSDSTPPETTPTASPGPNANGWNSTNVTVTLNAIDNPGGSGVQQIQFSLTGAQSGAGVVNANTASVVISGEGITTLTYAAQDAAGNAEPQKTLIIQIDRTPPAVNAVASPKANGNSWNNTNVTVTFSGTDAGSGIDFCTGAITFLREGAGQSASGACTDKAGNTGAPATATINIDRTLPVISGMPAHGCSLWPPNHRLVQVAVVSAADSLSGLASGSFQVKGVSNEPDARAPQVVITRSNAGAFVVQLEAARLGNGTGRIYTLMATASDLAGNTVNTTAICTVAHGQPK